MATFEDLMQQARAAYASGDIKTAKELGAQAKAIRSAKPGFAPIQPAIPVDAPTPTMPQDPPQADFTGQIAALMGPPIQQTAVGQRTVAPAAPAQAPDWIKQAVAQPAPVAPVQPAPVAPAMPAANPLDMIATALGMQPARGMGQPEVPEWITQAQANPPPANQTPLGPAIIAELGNVPERIERGFRGNALLSQERSIVEGITAVGRGKRIEDDLAAIRQQKKEAEATFALTPPDQIPALTARIQKLGQQEDMLARAAATPGFDQAVIDEGRSRATEANVKRLPNQEAIDALTASMTPVNPAPGLDAALVSGIASLGDMAPGLATTLATRNPIPMLAYLGAYSRGSSYVDKRAEGYDSGKAVTAANLYAVAEAIPEIVPLAVILDRGIRPAAKIAGGAISEGASEVLTQALQQMVDMGVLDESMTWGEAVAEMQKAGAAGAVMGGLMGGAGVVADVGRNAMQRRREAKGTPADPNALPPMPNPAAPSPPPAAPLDQIAAAMQPPAPDAPPVIPAPSQAAPQAPQPDPLSQITAAMTGQPASADPPPQSGQNGQTITRAEVEANPDRYEIVDESEGQGPNWRPTGAQVAIDKTTGQALPLAPETAAAPPPAAVGAPGGVDSAGQSQAAPVQGSGGVPAAGPAPEAEVVKAAGGVAPPAVPNQPRNFEFIDAAGVQNIGTEPDVMQYKAGGDSEGVTDRLRGVTEWRPERAGMSIIYEYADGRRVIADGHQRLGLAKRLAGQGKGIQMPAMILRQVDGVTPEEARVSAALKNIAEGSGTALDAAKVLRGTDKTPAQLDLPPNSAIVRDATGMRNLSDQAFGMVVNGVASERDGGIVGRVVTDQGAQANILGMLARMQKERPITAFQAESVAKQAAAATTTETQDSLFGPETDTKNLYLERAKILEAASSMKRDEAKAFKNVIANADRLQAAGNQLDADGNQTRLDSAAAMRDYLTREANTKGAISEALTAAARALNGGAKIGAATRQFLDAVERELGARSGKRPSSDQGGQTAGSQRPQEPGDQGVTQGGEAELPQGDQRDENAADGDMFGGPSTPVQPPFTPPSPPPGDDLFGATTQTGKTPEQIRAEAEAKVQADQSKLRKPGGNSGDAGPLFDPQPDMLDPTKAEARPRQPVSGEELIQNGRAILQQYSGDSDALFNQQSGTDLRSSLEGVKLAEDLLAAKTMAAKKKVADAFVLASGRRTGNEHLVVLDENGVPLAIMAGWPASVGVHAEVYRAADAGIVGYATHNHPRSSSHSGPDVAMLFAGFSPLTVMGHDGTSHTIEAAPGTSVDWEGKRKSGIPATKDLGDVFAQLRFRLDTTTNRMVNDDTSIPIDKKPAHWAKINVPLFPAILDRMGIVRYDNAAAANQVAALGINFEDIYGQVSGNGLDTLRRAGLIIPEGRGADGNRPADGDSKATPPGPDGADSKPDANAGSGDGKERVPRNPVSTGNVDLDGALDDIFGDESDVSGTGSDLEPGGGDGAATDGMGAGNVPAATRPSGRGTGRRSGKTAGGNGKRSSSSGLPDGDAPSVGAGGNRAPDGSGGTDSQLAAGGNGGRRDGGGNGRLPSDTGGKGNTAGNASGAAPKLTPAERLAAIRNALKEDIADFVAGPPRRDDEAREFAASLKRELGLRDLSMFVSGAGDLRLSMIAVPRDQQSQGIGSEAMRQIIDFADERGLRITLSVGQPDDGFGTTSRNRLVRFYKRFGFVENKGRNKDFALSPGMYRMPRGQAMREDPANPIDPQKADALESIFVDALQGVDISNATDRQVFVQIVMPMRDLGMTRDEIAELSPYLNAFLGKLRAGRINLDPETDIQQLPIDRLNAVVPGWSGVNGMLTNPNPELGGIIDKGFSGGKWFVILNGSTRSIEDLDTQDAAVDWFIENHAKGSKPKPPAKIVPGDRDNIDKTLPLLLPVQRDDVFKVETRFAKPDGHGFLLTNGTGTGKTYSGAGVAKRFYHAGKTNILIIGPDATLPGWDRTLDALAIPARKLMDTKDSGEGVVYTTHENAGMNNALASREWDLVIVDESQKLSSNASGESTDVLDAVRALTHRPQDLWRKSRMLHAKAWEKYGAMPDGEARTQEYNRLKAVQDKEVAAWAQKPRPKLLMLSATPFAYDKSIDYAEGYLFDYPKDGRIGNSNQGGRELFMVSNFGYRIRYHKLTRPEHAVDSAIFEREFHEKLKRDGVLSGRSLQVDVDYDRRFVTVADAIGTEIDGILKTISEGSRSADKALADGYQTISKHMRARFGYLPRMQLLEAIKAKAAVEDIKKHLALGRKVVVFHDFNKGGGFNPFAGMRILDDANALAAMADLTTKHPDWEKLNFSGYPAPNVGLKAAFGDRAGVFSGITKKDRDAQLNAFNTDGSGVDVLIVQSDAGGAGVSMHDVTGQHQRVLINLGMPVKPTTTLQSEGRILRVGTKTDAAFRYYTIGTSWERTAFAQRIAERSGTVENLALGNEARAITSAFIDAYMDAETFDPSDADGKGGKEKDRSGQVTTPWQKAISYYFGRMKVTGRRDQRQGLDYYPTPEPLGLKMIEWAGIRPNERVLEPSAGDGAIARFMPDNAAITLVEPSDDLGSTALLRQPRANLVSSTFENHHISNKYHVIVMNPPFGSGGKTAMDHLAKAAKHLRPGGRIVALIPTGPSADKKFATWWESDDAKGLNLSAEVQLPAVAFERAGTSVMTRVVILDKLADGQTVPMGQQNLNFTGATTIQQFFDRLESYDVRRRPDPVQDVIEELEAEGQDAETPIATGQGPAVAPGTFEMGTYTSKKGKVFPTAKHPARLGDLDYIAMAQVAELHGGWRVWMGQKKTEGPTFGFKNEAGRDAFLADVQKPTAPSSFEETAYHGTPHDFDRFTLKAIGTGEGAQVYGWGLYFASNRKVAEYYRNTLSRAGLLIDGVKPDPTIFRPGFDSQKIDALKAIIALNPATKPDEVSGDVWKQAQSLMHYALHDVVMNLKDKVDSDGSDPKERLAIYRNTYLEMYRGALQRQDNGEALNLSQEPYPFAARIAAVDWLMPRAELANPSRLYTVDIPGPENVLEWEARINDQPAEVQERLAPVLDAIRNYYRGREKALNGGLDGFMRNLTGREVIDFLQSHGALYGIEPDGYSFAKRVDPKVSYVIHQVVNDRTGDVLAEADSRFYALRDSGIRPDQYASLALRKLGIPGHRYLDGSSRSAGEGSHNYVIYDDAAIQIIAKEQRAQMVREAAATTEEVTRLMPKLRAELDRLDLKRVRLSRAEGATWQGAFVVTGDGEMEIVIGASLNPIKTLHHEVIHALRAMNLFTGAEWQALTLAAERKWLAKHDIAARYPHLTEAERIEEAIAEEFSEALAAKQAPKGSILIQAFNKIARIFRALRNVLNGAGYQTPEDIFGRVLAGEVSARKAGNTGAQAGMAMQATPEMFADYMAAKAEASRLRDELKNPAKTEAQIEAAFDKMIAVGPVRAKLAETLAAEDGGLELKAKHGGSAAISKSQDGKGGWRTTYFNDRGFSGHTEYATKVEAIKEALQEGYDELDTGALRRAMKSGTFFARFQRKGRDTDTGDLFAQPEPARPSGMTADQRREMEARAQQSKMRKTGGNSGDAGPLFNDDKDLFGQRTMFQRQPLAVRPLTPQARAHRNSAMGATPFIPDRRIWESLTRAGIPIWQRLRDLPGAASDAVDRARYTIQDRMLPFLRAQEAVMRQIGRPLPKEHDAYLQETTFSGKVGRHLLEIDEEYTKPIIQIIAKSKGKITADSVGEWLYARHAIERNAYIASINPNMPDGGSGMENIDAAQIMADIANSPEAAQYNQIGALIDALRERNLKLREDAGLISNDDANLWRTQYKHYVPLKGFEETDHYESMMDLRGVRTGRRFSIRGAETRRALGRVSEAFNPLQSALTQAQEVAIRAEKNRVAVAMYELAASYPSKALWEVKKPKQKRYFNRTTGLVESRVENPVTMVLEPNEMAVKIDGKEHRILFNDQRLAESAGTLGADQMGAALRALSLFSRFFSMTRTMLNPEFMITNAFRDFQTAQFNIQAFGEADKARIAKAMAKNWRKAFMGAMRGSTYRFDTEWSRYYREFQKAGAQVWFWTMENPEAARGDLEKRIELARGSKARRAIKVMTSPSAFFSFRDNAALNFIERTNLAVDNAIRLAAFVEARRAGWDVEKAAFLAKELTVNFNRRGEAGAQMNALYPFFNAAVQGSVRTIKALSSRRVALMVLTAFAAGALNDLLNAALSDEDDDGELLYDKVPNFRNERNFHMVLWGTGDSPLSIPMPYGYNLFPYAGQQLGKVIRGVKQPDEAFGDVVKAAFGAFSPINAATPAQMISPVLSDPVVEMAENKNWLGTPIYPQDYGNQSEPDAYVHFKGATEVSKWVAQSLNSLTGGDFRESGAVDVSPETLDHLSSFVVGSAGAFWGRSADVLGKVIKGDFDSIEQRNIPFLRNLTSPVGDWQDRDRFYRFSAEVKNAQADKNAYEAAGMPVPAKTAKLAALYPQYLAANREMQGKGAWNPAKVGSVAARAQSKVWLDFNGKYLRVMGKQGE